MSNNEWISKYRSNKDAVWIKCRLSNGDQYYEDSFKGWLKIKDICDKQKCFVEELKFSFRSHEVNVSIDDDAEAIYLINAAMGQIGSETKHYYTTGTLKNGIVYKKMWLIPELVVEKKLEDDLGECFKEALIYNEEKKQDRQE